MDVCGVDLMVYGRHIIYRHRSQHSRREDLDSQPVIRVESYSPPTVGPPQTVEAFWGPSPLITTEILVSYSTREG